MAAEVKFDQRKRRGGPGRQEPTDPAPPSGSPASPGLLNRHVRIIGANPRPVRNLQLTYRSVTLWRMAMRAIEAKTFSGYVVLRQIELPKPPPARGKVLVRLPPARVTPLDYTILSGGHPRAKAPLVVGNEGAGVIEDAGGSGIPGGSGVGLPGVFDVR